MIRILKHPPESSAYGRRIPRPAPRRPRLGPGRPLQMPLGARKGHRHAEKAFNDNIRTLIADLEAHNADCEGLPAL